MIEIVKSPARIDRPDARLSFFLAGSIDMGKAKNWQAGLQKKLQRLDVVIFNPRREDWDRSWKQDISDENFSGQVNWELDHLEKSNFILFYFDPMTKAPVSLMELGLFAKSGKCIVCCPEGFWRRGNVQIVCARYKISLFDDIENLLKRVSQLVTSAKSGVKRPPTAQPGQEIVP